MDTYNTHLTTATIDDIITCINSDEEYGKYLKEYKFKYGGVISRLFDKAIETDEVNLLTTLHMLFGQEDFCYFANANSVTLKSLKSGNVNILKWMNDNRPFTEAAAYKIAAASYGNVEVLKTLHTMNTYWFTEAFNCASYFYETTSDEKYKACIDFITETTV